MQAIQRVFEIVNQILQDEYHSPIRVREAYDLLLNNFHICFVEETHREELYTYYFWAREYLQKSPLKSDILQTFVKRVEEHYDAERGTHW